MIKTQKQKEIKPQDDNGEPSVGSFFPDKIAEQTESIDSIKVNAPSCHLIDQTPYIPPRDGFLSECPTNSTKVRLGYFHMFCLIWGTN